MTDYESVALQAAVARVKNKVQRVLNPHSKTLHISIHVFTVTDADVPIMLGTGDSVKITWDLSRVLKL